MHCGWTLGIVERTLPVVTLNSSAFHNVHHEKVTTHFGEISYLWDYLCGTSPIYEQGLAAGYRWHVERSQATTPERLLAERPPPSLARTASVCGLSAHRAPPSIAHCRRHTRADEGVAARHDQSPLKELCRDL